MCRNYKASLDVIIPQAILTCVPVGREVSSGLAAVSLLCFLLTLPILFVILFHHTTNILLAAQSLINLQDTNGSTSLFMAVEKGHSSVTKQLITARCNVDLQDSSGSTPIHLAGYKGHVPVTIQVLGELCNVDLETRIVSTALQPAQIQTHTGIATLIRNTKHKGADRAMKDNSVQTGPARLPEHPRGDPEDPST